MTEQDRSALRGLIQRLDQTEPQTSAEGQAKWRAWWKTGRDAMLTGASYGQAIGSADIYGTNGEAFEETLRKTADSAWHQCVLIHRFLDIWFKDGDPVPPYFVARIPVICRKAKEPDLERAFLAAILRHREGVHQGARFQTVVDRAEKLGVAF
jgi:hypothetical protein